MRPVHDPGGRSLRPLFDPRSLAVVGASSHETKWGFRLAVSALSDRDRRAVYLVNRNGGSILGERLYRSLSELPEVPELVVVAVPAGDFGAVVEQAVNRGTRAIVGITAGLGEQGGTAAASECSLALRVGAAGAVMVGPNCAGLADSTSSLHLEFSQRPSGTVGLVSQSGNLVEELAQLAGPLGLGYSRYVSIGNQADLVAADFIDDLVEHDGTEAIACYVEDFKDGGDFIRAAGRAVAAGKPVAVLSVGRSHAGSRSALSHTGALVSDERLVRAACRAAGAELVTTPSELVDLLEGWRSPTATAGRRVGILGDGGGLCGIAADALSCAGLEVPELGRDLAGRLAAMLPPAASTANPVDIAGAAETDLQVYERVLAMMLASPEIDAVLLTGYFGGYSSFSSERELDERSVARAIVATVSTSTRPLVVHSIHPASPVMGILREARIPVYQRIESAARGLAALSPAAPRGAAPAGAARQASLIESAIRQGETRTESDGSPGGYWAAREFVSQAGVAQSVARRVHDIEQARIAALHIGYPVVLKALGFLHKSDCGGIVLGIESETHLGEAFEDLRRRSSTSEYSVEAMASLGQGVEMIVGVRRDPTFGLVTMVGLGGVFAEVFADVAVFLSPATAAEVERRVLELCCAPMLTGTRGRVPLDVAALARAASSLVGLAAVRDDVLEVEVNPLVVLPDGVMGLDARLVRIGAGSPEKDGGVTARDFDTKVKEAVVP